MLCAWIYQTLLIGCPMLQMKMIILGMIKTLALLVLVVAMVVAMVVVLVKTTVTAMVGMTMMSQKGAHDSEND